jgi:hypothetical protein
VTLIIHHTETPNAAAHSKIMFYTYLLKNDLYFSGLKGINNLRYIKHSNIMTESSDIHLHTADNVRKTAVLMNCCKGLYWLQRVKKG